MCVVCVWEGDVCLCVVAGEALQMTCCHRPPNNILCSISYPFLKKNTVAQYFVYLVSSYFAKFGQLAQI